MLEDMKKLRGRKVAVIAADGFELVELVVPKKALELAGAEVHVLSIHPGRIRGMNLTEPSRAVRVDRTIAESDPDEYDALLIPGGFVGPDFLRQSEEARTFASAFDAAGKPIATLCHGPWLLVSAGLVRGRALASWPSLRDDIVNAGGVWRDEELVRDGNWVSSRGPQDLDVFVKAMIDAFARGATTSRDPVARESSPPVVAPIPMAVAAARWLPGPGMVAAGALALGAAALAARRLVS